MILGVFEVTYNPVSLHYSPTLLFSTQYVKLPGEQDLAVAFGICHLLTREDELSNLNAFYSYKSIKGEGGIHLLL